MDTRKKWARTLGAFMICLIVRLIPVRAPNVEPILAVQMPFAKRYGPFLAFLFGFASILLYDIITSRVGIWTLITALAYGALGIASSLYFKHRSGTRKQFVTFAIGATILYDAITGLTIGPLFFHQSFVASFVGQIPFTALHLLGNILFALLLSPAINRYLMRSEAESRSFVENPITHPSFIS